jgi:ribose 5-phosphate isomerase RpiB
MDSNASTSANVLVWPKRVLSADDLRRHLTSQRELLLLPRTVITPLAADELKAKGVRVVWEKPKAEQAAPRGTWLVGQEKSDGTSAAAIDALVHEGFTLRISEIAGPKCIRQFAEQVIMDQTVGILFYGDPGVACCIANKVAGIRAVAVFNAAQVTQAKTTLGANLFAMNTAGLTYFEVRQMLRSIISDAAKGCDRIATLLQELDGHAHR